MQKLKYITRPPSLASTALGVDICYHARTERAGCRPNGGRMTEDAPLTLYYHPFASFCQKVLIALYEN